MRHFGGFLAVTFASASARGAFQNVAAPPFSSGKPLKTRSTEIIRHIYTRTKGEVSIIGVGGIFNARDAWEKIGAGASLIQVYSGMVYEGPSMARSIIEGIRDQMELHGFNSIQDIVGKELEFIEET